MVGPNKQDFWPKINILKGNHCTLRIQGAPIRQKSGLILENKVVQKLEKNIYRRIVLKQFPLRMLILGQRSSILRPTIFKIPQLN